MGLFGKKEKSRDEIIAEAAELNEVPQDKEKKDDVSTGNEKIDIELTKIQGRLEGLDEVRKASSERFSRISEQVGELRGMIMDTNKAMSKVEVSSTKAIDLVESVHPEKLMIEVRKQDGKVEALRASIESNEAIMKDLMLELKKMRDKMNFYKGIEQVMEMNEEIKQELSTIKKVEATIEQHADKVETIFVEVEKKFADFDKFNDVVKDLDKSFKKLASDFEKLRVKTEMKQERKEFVDLLDRFNEFEKHTTNLLKLMDERNKTVRDEMSAQFKKLVIQYRARLEKMRPPPPQDPSKAKKEEKKEEEKEEEPSSGEDGAGADQKPGIMTRIKGMFKRDSDGEEKKEGEEEEKEEEEDEELFPETEADKQAAEELAQAEKNAEEQHKVDGAHAKPAPTEGEKPPEGEAKEGEKAEGKAKEGEKPADGGEEKKEEAPKEGEKPTEGEKPEEKKEEAPAEGDKPPEGEKPAEGDKPAEEKPEEKKEGAPADGEKPAEEKPEKKKEAPAEKK